MDGTFPIPRQPYLATSLGLALSCQAMLFWYLKQGQAKDLLGPLSLVSCCQQSWFQGLSQSVLGWGILHKLGPRPWFPYQPGGWGGVG